MITLVDRDYPKCFKIPYRIVLIKTKYIKL